MKIDLHFDFPSNDEIEYRFGLKVFIPHVAKVTQIRKSKNRDFGKAKGVEELLGFFLRLLIIFPFSFVFLFFFFFFCVRNKGNRERVKYIGRVVLCWWFGCGREGLRRGGSGF